MTPLELTKSPPQSPPVQSPVLSTGSAPDAQSSPVSQVLSSGSDPDPPNLDLRIVPLEDTLLADQSSSTQARTYSPIPSKAVSRPSQSKRNEHRKSSLHHVGPYTQPNNASSQGSIRSIRSQSSVRSLRSAHTVDDVNKKFNPLTTIRSEGSPGSMMYPEHIDNGSSVYVVNGQGPTENHSQWLPNAGLEFVKGGSGTTAVHHFKAFKSTDHLNPVPIRAESPPRQVELDNYDRVFREVDVKSLPPRKRSYTKAKYISPERRLTLAVAAILVPPLAVKLAIGGRC